MDEDFKKLKEIWEEPKFIGIELRVLLPKESLSKMPKQEVEKYLDFLMKQATFFEAVLSNFFFILGNQKKKKKYFKLIRSMEDLLLEVEKDLLSMIEKKLGITKDKMRNFFELYFR